MPEVVIVLTTLPAGGSESIARTLVDERLAACVNALPPMTSFYRWKGVIEQELEQQIVIKTLRGRVPALLRRLRELHPYELPELLVVRADEGSDAYLAWIRDNVEPT
jgi:periplasmic divalent cation tolerance protein